MQEEANEQETNKKKDEREDKDEDACRIEKEEKQRNK